MHRCCLSGARVVFFHSCFFLFEWTEDANVHCMKSLVSVYTHTHTQNTEHKIQCNHIFFWFSSCRRRLPPVYILPSCPCHPLFGALIGEYLVQSITISGCQLIIILILLGSCFFFLVRNFHSTSHLLRLWCSVCVCVFLDSSCYVSLSALSRLRSDVAFADYNQNVFVF